MIYLCNTIFAAADLLVPAPEVHHTLGLVGDLCRDQVEADLEGCY